jgi:hypothetical protein
MEEFRNNLDGSLPHKEGSRRLQGNKTILLYFLQLLTIPNSIEIIQISKEDHPL